MQYPDSLQDRIPNRFAGADEYDVEPGKVQGVKVIVHTLFDRAVPVVAAKKACMLASIARRQSFPILPD